MAILGLILAYISFVYIRKRRMNVSQVEKIERKSEFKEALVSETSRVRF